MSKVLFNARRQITQVSSLLRQNSVVNAVQTLYGGLVALNSESLLKSEREEFSNLISEATKNISNHRVVREQFAMQLNYTPGNEKALIDDLRALLDGLEAMALSDAEKAFKEKEEQKRNQFAKAVAAFGANNAEEGKAIFAALQQEFSSDVLLLVDMAEVYEKHGLLDEAASLLEQALQFDPHSAYIKNKLGILYRKMKKFEESEARFKEALALVPDDPYVYFNTGRLYIDQQRWAEAKEVAEKALACSPEFNEAKMLAEYAAKRL